MEKTQKYEDQQQQKRSHENHINGRTNNNNRKNTTTNNNNINNCKNSRKEALNLVYLWESFFIVLNTFFTIRSKCLYCVPSSQTLTTKVDNDLLPSLRLALWWNVKMFEYEKVEKYSLSTSFIKVLKMKDSKIQINLPKFERFFVIWCFRKPSIFI